MNQLLIDFETLNLYFSLSEYLEENPKVGHSILQAQDKYIKPVLGREFYNAILADPDEYEALMPYIQKALAYYFGVEFTVMNAVSLTPAGVQVMGSEWATNAPSGQVNEMKGALNNAGQAAVEDLRAYLYANKADYPLYEEHLRKQLSSTMGVWA